MAPSQMEHQQTESFRQGYTHKKFNCSYSHKKLGMRLRHRDENHKENIDRQHAAKKQALFRPYDLGNDTPRKRKISRSSSDSSDDENSQTQFTASPQLSPVTATGQASYPSHEQSTAFVNSQNCSSSALSPNSYAERLQRQRAALYMRYMQQFHSGNMAAAAAAQGAVGFSAQYPMGYPNVTAPIYNGW